MGLTFEDPRWLLLILLALPAAWAGLRWFAPMSRARRWSAVALRVVLIALVSAMLAGASAVRQTDRVAVIGVVDVSGSVRLFGDVGAAPQASDSQPGLSTDPPTQARPRDPIQAVHDYFAQVFRSRGPEDLAGLVVFDGQALAVATPTRAQIGDRSLDIKMVEGTDMAAALRYAAALVPPDAAGRIVLVGDGNQTSGDALAAARALAGGNRSGSGRTPRAGMPVDVIPIALSAASEVIVESVDAPPRATAEATISVRVTLFATSSASGTLNLLHNNEPMNIGGGSGVLGRRIRLSPGRHVELISVPLPPGPLHPFRAVFVPDAAADASGAQRPVGDTRLENNSGEAITISPGKGSVLLVDGVSGGAPGGPGSSLAAPLRDAGISVTVLPPEGIPGNLLALQAYDLIILENVPAEAVPEPTQKALVAHVRDMGAGLVMVGGPDSLGAGGWKGSALEPILPVRLDLPEKLIQPDAAIVFVIDNSGSMGRGVMGSMKNQQEIANQAAAMAVKSLDAKDLVGVVVFNSQTTVLVPLEPNSDPAKTSERLLSISPGGGTVLGPAIEEARRQLGPAKASIKHIIVLSDGRSQDADPLPRMAAAMNAQDGIVVSTIAIGDEADERTLAEMAAAGKGQFYAVNNPSLLPRFLLKAVRVVRTPLIRRGEFRPVILPAASPLTAGLSDPPPLYGLVLTQPRPEATITYAMATPTGEPLLAHWNVELGQAAVFTSDALPDEWARAWLDWPGYRQMWTQIARTLARSASPGRLELTTEVAGDTLRLRLEASDQDGRPLDLLSAPATVYGPSGTPVEVSLSQTGPGIYEAQVPAAQSGGYIATIAPRLGDQRLPPVIAGVSVASGIEYRNLTANTALLEQIARETGGRVLSLQDPAAADLFNRDGLEPSVARTPLWRPLLLWTLLVLLMDVGTRRIAWDRFVSREFGVDLRKAARETVKDRGAAATGTTARLRGGAARAGEPAPGSALTDVDAQRLAEQEAERRRSARLAALQAAREARRESGGDAPADPGPDLQASPPSRRQPKAQPGSTADNSASGGTDSLLAAKRRARERLDGDAGPPEQT